MKKKSLFCILSLLVVCSVSHAVFVPTDVSFRLDAPKTELVFGERVVVTLSASVVDLDTGTNGLNYWSLSAMVNTGGVFGIVDGVEVDGLVEPLGLVPNDFVMNWSSINDAATGGTASIEYLNVQPASAGMPTGVGVGGYTPIAMFEIEAIGSVGQSITYTLGDSGLGFDGILEDFTVLDGQFDLTSDRTFTIVPEPATLLMLGLGTVMAYRRKK